MAEKIRRIEKKDFKEVSDLFEGQAGNSVDELMWLFTNPENSNEYSAYVAVDDDTIVGVIAYELSIYQNGESEIVVMDPMSWMLKSDYKGMAGISLFKKVSQLGDIALTIGGEEVSKSLYPLFKYKFLLNADNYYKILNPASYFKILKRSSLLKKIGMFGFLLPSYFRNAQKKLLYNDLNLIPYNTNNFFEEKEHENIFQKKITKNYIDWQLKCPRLKIFAFAIKKGNDNLGMCILYIQKTDNELKGRIAHLPFLGYDESIWVSTIEKCITFFINEGCCFVSGLAINKMCQTGLFKSGFLKIKKQSEPLYIKDSNQVMTSPNVKSWHLQFSEGDIGLLNF